jgi:hypothetical protein
MPCTRKIFRRHKSHSELFHDIQAVLRANNPQWLHLDRLHVDMPDRTEVVSIDLTNSQFVGMDHGVGSLKEGYASRILLPVLRAVCPMTAS